MQFPSAQVVFFPRHLQPARLHWLQEKKRDNVMCVVVVAGFGLDFFASTRQFTQWQTKLAKIFCFSFDKI